jgi:hypothetical protein
MVSRFGAVTLRAFCAVSAAAKSSPIAGQYPRLLALRAATHVASKSRNSTVPCGLQIAQLEGVEFPRQRPAASGPHISSRVAILLFLNFVVEPFDVGSLIVQSIGLHRQTVSISSMTTSVSRTGP